MKNIYLTNQCYNHLTENGQKAKNAFCLVNKDLEKDQYKTVSPWFICRDYFSDVAYTLNTGHPCSAYGFDSGEYDWHGGGFITTISDVSEDKVMAALESVNEYMKKWDCPTISIERIKVVNPESIKLSEAEKSFNYYCMDMREGEGMYFVSTPEEWTQSTYHLYTLSSIIRSLYWFALGGVDYMNDTMEEVVRKLTSVEVDIDRPEFTWTNLFNDIVMPAYSEVHVTPAKNAMCNSGIDGEYLCLKGIEALVWRRNKDYGDDDDYEDDECCAIDLVHDIGGGMSVATIPVQLNILPWIDWHGNWDPRTIDSYIKEKDVANGDIELALAKNLKLMLDTKKDEKLAANG